MGATSEHFSAAQLCCHHCHVNGCTEKLVNTLEVFRAFIGRPIIINDAYRCAEHNAKIGGAIHSEHFQGLAADIRVDGMTAAELENVARRIGTIKGIGRDDRKNYIHIDVRDEPASWCYSPDGKWCTYYPPAVYPATSIG